MFGGKGSHSELSFKKSLRFHFQSVHDVRDTVFH